MAFFSDLKKIGSAAISAASDGAKLLNDAANALERGSQILSLKSSAKLLETQIAFATQNNLTFDEQKEKERELLSLYEKLILCVDSYEKEQLLSKKENLILGRKRTEISQQIDQISELQSEIAESIFSEPIDKLTKVKNIVSKIDELIEFIGNDTASNLVHELQAIKRESLEEIEILELKRNNVELEHYSSGMLKSRIHKRDGQKHGRSEFWYENGVKRLELYYSTGQLSAEACKWRDEGSLILKANYGHLSEKLDLELFSQNGARVFWMHRDKYNDGFAKLWLSNEIYIGQIDFKGEKILAIQKIILVVKFIFNFRLWIKLLMLKYKNSNLDKTIIQLLKELNIYLTELEDFYNEITFLNRSNT